MRNTSRLLCLLLLFSNRNERRFVSSMLSLELQGMIETKANGLNYITSYDMSKNQDIVVVGDSMALNDDGVQSGAVYIYR